MEKFIVPQFIDIENKILGPITVRQFVTVAVGGTFIFISYRLADFALFLLLTPIIGIMTGVVAFVRFNGLPFHIFLFNVVATYKKPILRVWLKSEDTVTKKSLREGRKKDAKDAQPAYVPRKSVSSEKLSELALIIDTGGVYKGEEEANKSSSVAYGGTR